jgi:hypothetical protein
MVSFTSLPVYPGERRHCAHRVGNWMGCRGGQDVLGKSQMCYSYQNRNPDLSERIRNTVLSFMILGKRQMCCSYENRTVKLSERRRNTVLSFIIIVISVFRLSGLDFEFLSLNDKRYKIVFSKVSCIKCRDQRLGNLCEKIR